MSRKRLLILALVASIGIGSCTSADSRREESLRRAREASAQGDLDRAAKILRAAHGFDPRDRQIVAALAEIYEESRDYWRASRLVESFPEEAGTPRWLNLRARLLLHCGRVREGGRLSASLAQRDEAEEETFRTLSDVVFQRKLDPERVGGVPAAWVRRLAERLLDAGETGVALSWMEGQPPVGDLEEDMLLRRLAEVALETDDRDFVRRVGGLVRVTDSPLELLVHRRRLVLAGRTADVARLDRRFLAGFPDHPRRGDILESEGRRQLAHGDLEQALSHADEALELDGSSVGALIVRGLALEWSGRPEEGRAALRMVLALEPDNRVAREALRSNQNPESLIMRIESLGP